MIAGFRAGAKRGDPRIRLLNTYADDFSDEAKCRNVALDQIAHGSRVVFDVAGACGVGALKAAKQKGVYGIGVDTDQSWRGRFILTSAVLNWGLGVYDLAERVVQGQLRTGGNLSWDMSHHFVGLGRFSPKVHRSLQRQLKRLALQIKHGKIVVPTTSMPDTDGNPGRPVPNGDGRQVARAGGAVCQPPGSYPPVAT